MGGLLMDNDLRRELIAKSPISFSGLRKLNIGAGVFLGVQGILMIALGLLLTWKREIYTFYLKFKIISLAPPSFQVLPDPQVAFTVTNLGVILASFLLISAFALLTIAFVKNKNYVEYLKKGMNPYRWYEYFFSSSIMLVIIATFVGVWDLWSLVMIFVLNAVLIMCGYLMEKINFYSKKTDWSAYLLGCLSGFTPWIVLAAYFIAALGSSDTNPPTFVYLTLLFYFIIFNTFSINMILQYKGVGKWKDYLYGERVYILLSFTAKTILAWLVFIGVFAPF
jgi:Heliorhodopsin